MIDRGTPRHSWINGGEYCFTEQSLILGATLTPQSNGFPSVGSQRELQGAKLSL